MSDQYLTIDDNLLDELVTGNLHGDRYRQTIQSLEARPHLWRTCAIAFLKEQALAQDLRGLAKGDIDWSCDLGRSSPAAGLDARVTCRPTMFSDTRFSDTQRLAWVQRFAALAALLVCSFSIGWMGAGLRSNSATALPLDGAVSQAGVLGSTRQVLNDLTGEPVQARDPVRSISSASLLASDRFMPIDLQVPPELRELERQGKIRIETVDAIMPVQLEDGSSAIVPVQQFRVVPVMFSY